MAAFRANLKAVEMALYSAFVEAGSENYCAQIEAASAHEAFRVFCVSIYNDTVPGLTASDAPNHLTAADIIHVTKMDGLTNMWFCQAGREGKYVSVTMARTVARAAV